MSSEHYLITTALSTVCFPLKTNYNLKPPLKKSLSVKVWRGRAMLQSELRAMPCEAHSQQFYTNMIPAVYSCLHHNPPELWRRRKRRPYDRQTATKAQTSNKASNTGPD